MAEKAALDIARYVRAVPSKKGKEINITLYKVLIAVEDVTLERSTTVSFHEEKGWFGIMVTAFQLLRDFI